MTVNRRFAISNSSMPGLAGLQLVGLGLRYGLQLLAAAAAGAAAYGRFAVVFAAATIASGLLSLGLRRNFLRHASVTENLFRTETGRFLIGSVYLVTVGLAGAIGVAAGLSPFADTLPYHTGAIVGFATIIALHEAFAEALRTAERQIFSFVCQHLVMPLMANLAILALWSASTGQVTESHLIAAVATGHGVAWLALQARLPSPARPSFAFLTRELRSSAPIALSDSARIISTQGPVILLSMAASANVVGQFALAVRIAALPAVVAQSLAWSSVPRISKKLACHRIAEASLLLRSLLKPLVAVAAATTALLVISTPFIEKILPGFDGVWGLLVILCLGMFVAASTGPVSLLLIGTGHQKFEAVTYSVAAITTLAAVPLLASNIGPTGVAAGVALIAAGQNLWQYVGLGQRTGMRLPGLTRLNAEWDG